MHLIRCWKPEQLKSISSHYSRPEEQLPEAMIESIVKSKNINQGLFNLRQLFHGKFDSVYFRTRRILETLLTCALDSSDYSYQSRRSGFDKAMGRSERGNELGQY